MRRLCEHMRQTFISGIQPRGKTFTEYNTNSMKLNAGTKTVSLQ